MKWECCVCGKTANYPSPKKNPTLEHSTGTCAECRRKAFGFDDPGMGFFRAWYKTPRIFRERAVPMFGEVADMEDEYGVDVFQTGEQKWK